MIAAAPTWRSSHLSHYTDRATAPALHARAAAASPPGSPPPPPPPPTAWMAPPTPTPAAETTGPSRGPPGYTPVPMRVLVDEEAAPPLGTTAGSSSRAERRFGRLFERAVAAIDRRPGRHAGSWAPASLGRGAARQDLVVIASSSDE
ncbi:hypothetical protein ZWY2020_002135 [Hordeum vulgare]|nr:hypothetical protein ZWY2020_002135 [Hordeum vulgare]